MQAVIVTECVMNEIFQRHLICNNRLAIVYSVIMSFSMLGKAAVTVAKDRHFAQYDD